MTKIELLHDEHSWRIRLNDPPLNILDITMLEELEQALSSIRNDRHLLIIEAAGDKAFSAGASVQDHLGDRVKTMLGRFHNCFRQLERLELITVALVHGAALGGGCELALACDFILASQRATFGQPEIKLGVFPPVAAYQLSRQLAPRKGLELLLTGQTIDAITAANLGIINAVFPQESFREAAADWLTRLTALSASSLRFAKKAWTLAQPSDFSERLGQVEQLYLDGLMKSEDAEEGLQAFIAKRVPSWKNR